MTGAYKFTSDYGYGALGGLFIEDSADVDFLIKHGDKIYFYAGEVLGKYSEISDYIHTCDIQVLSTDENIVNILRDIGAELGYNPLRFEICPYDMGSEFCPECGIEWENVTVIEYIRLVRDGILPSGYQNGDVDINVIYNLQSKFKSYCENNTIYTSQSVTQLVDIGGS